MKLNESVAMKAIESGAFGALKHVLRESFGSCAGLNCFHHHYLIRDQLDKQYQTYPNGLIHALKGLAWSINESEDTEELDWFKLLFSKAGLNFDEMFYWDNEIE